MPDYCPVCGSDALSKSGSGTQKIEVLVKELYPQYKVERIDSDILTKKNAHIELLNKFQKGEIDILVGTQMIAKGLDNPNVTIVGVISADMSFNLPDYRSCERGFQLLTQVAGRAGRGSKKGEVYLQTLHPENAVLRALVDGNAKEFFDLEKQTRKIMKMPPYGRLAAVIVSGANKQMAENCAIALGKAAFNDGKISTLGPAPAPIFMLREKYRYRLLLKVAKDVNIQDVIKQWIKRVKIPSTLRVEVDIDPYSFY